jgi:hypothetical protein
MRRPHEYPAQNDCGGTENTNDKPDGSKAGQHTNNEKHARRRAHGRLQASGQNMNK